MSLWDWLVEFDRNDDDKGVATKHLVKWVKEGGSRAVLFLYTSILSSLEQQGKITTLVKRIVIISFIFLFNATTKAITAYFFVVQRELGQVIERTVTVT